MRPAHSLGEGSAPPPESWLVVGLRAIALATAAAALLLEVALPAGTVGALVGTAGGVFVGGALARSRVRLWAIWAAGLAACGVAALVGGALVESSWGPSLFGMRGAMAAGDTVRFGVSALALVTALRTTAARHPTFAVLELSAIALALAGVVAAHRDGAINHPRVFSDWALTTGRDPVKILLYFGAGAAGTLALASMRERRGRGARVILHLLAPVGVALLALLLVRTAGLPQPPRGGLGANDKRPTKRDGQGQGQGGAGQGGGKNQEQDNDFKDDYSSPTEQRPVAIILLHDDYSPPLGYYYFRQTAFSVFNGHRLVQRTRDDLDEDILSDFPTERVEIPRAPKVGPERLRVRSTVAMMADHLRPFGLESPTAFEPKQSPDPARFVRIYDVESAALAAPYKSLLGRHQAALGTTASVYTELPDDPRYKKLADEIVEHTLRPEYRSDPFAQSIAISAWLGKNSTYTRKSRHASADDPTADFLFGDKRGYCVHFAHAAAYLLRARGLPTRIAAGYVADEGRKGSGSAIMLREKDAHEWAELWLDGFGWIIVDVAPENVEDPPETPPDPDLQRLLGEMARGDKQGGKMQERSPIDLPSLRSIAKGWGAVTALLLAIAYSVKAWRRLAPSWASARAIHRVAYRAAIDRVTEAGHRRRHGETRERFASRIGPLAPSLVPLTRHHVGRAFGSREVAPPDEMKRLARAAATEARTSAPRWRVLLGALNPISWMLSR